ncbi:MAG: cytochrome c biogenesis protein CcsA [Anaerolineae bacterium]
MNIAQRLGFVRTSATQDRLPILKVLTLLTIIGLAVGAYFALVYAGTDIDQGNVQRVFYFHVSAFSAASVAFACAVVGGAVYLRTRDRRWDTLALAGVEVGLALSLITLITGMVWARPIWNTWWTWDIRLTTTAIMTLTYAAYLMLRSGLESGEKQRLFASVYGILAIATVILTFVVIRIRPDTIHPTVIGPSAQNAQGGFSMTSGIGMALGINSAIWCCLVMPTLMWWRIRLENLMQRAEQLRVDLKD